MGKKLSAYNLYMRKALKGKLAGKTKAQRKAIFKAAARGWNKGKPKSRPRSKPKSGGSSRSSSRTRRFNSKMGKSTFNMNKIYGLIRKGAVFVPAADLAMRPWPTEDKISMGLKWYFGWDRQAGKFVWHELWNGWGPAVGAQVVTKVIPAIGKVIRGIF